MHLPPPSSRLRALLRLVIWAGIAVYFALALMVLALRHFVLPVIDDYRGDIERGLSQALAQPVAIRAIDAHWQGLRPNLRIRGLEIRDADGRPALGFDEVEADLAWSSLWHLAPHFARLEINAPSLELWRDRRGRLFVAGLEVKTDDVEGAGFSDWLLAQDRVVIRNATVTWRDELRQAPPLALSKLNFDLRNRGNRHRFGLTAEPPRELATRLDIRGDFRGRDLDTLATWRGEAYAELDGADLAGWRVWLDYPIEVPRGRGGLRLWVSVDREALAGITADLRLADMAVRMAPELPMLELARVDGRLAMKRLEDGLQIAAKRLTLSCRDGVRIEPTDLEVIWHPGTGTRPARGEASADGLDLGALVSLAGYMPLAETVRDDLVAHGPKGRVNDLHLSWTGDFDQLAGYSLRARFEDLGLRAHGAIPGFAGLDGRIDGNEKGGMLDLASRNAIIDLPAVFSESKMTLATLDARGDWKVGNDGTIDAQLQKATFQNDDAAGEVSGRYRGTAAAPGEIDLTARLTRAAGGAVWRYMPLVVNQETRDWLRNSIVGGAATATLRLKGDLKRFPFRDGSGVFEVKGPFRGANLNYASDWPGFEDVAGELDFVGARMTIRARQAKLWGVQLADVKAEIADLERSEEMMTITGIARGPTADFLRFIDSSPVGARIDRFTEDMVATGNGELRLRLDMPLRNIVDTAVDGRYRFLANGLTYDRDMPPLTDINGELHFTGNQLDGGRIRAAMLGAPMSLDIATEEGRVVVKAAGNMTVAALRQQWEHPLFEHLAGSAPWSGTIRVKKRAPEVRIESPLLGISSSLPEPFNKTASATLPLVFERGPAPEPPKARKAVADKASVERDQLKVSLGDSLRLQLVSRHEDGKAAIEQGLITINRPDARLPDRGVLLAAKAGRLDVDFWRRLARNGNGNGNGDMLPVSQIDLRADELQAFGRSLNALQLAGNFDGEIWRMDIKSREAVGRLEWSSREGADRLSARLAHLDVPESDDDRGQPSMDPTERLPAIDLVVERFSLHGREFGELWLEAENTEGVWNARFEARNEDGILDGRGRWQMQQAKTAIDFKLTARSVEGLLRQLGYPGAVRRGTATLEGTLSWAGSPTAFDYASLDGKLSLEAARGQFNKLEPGVGRLLSILSLQSLPRRISLDFRDVFSEGFAFDSIAGTVAVNRGMMKTEDFEIDGPAATVLMNGTVDLARETQDLKVRVQPAIGETVATGVLLVNPVMGAAAWVMNKMFGNPLDKVFAFDYAVTGSWEDPKVAKVAVQGPGFSAPEGVTP